MLKGAEGSRVPASQWIHQLTFSEALKNQVPVDAVEPLLLLLPSKSAPELLLSSNIIFFFCDFMEKLWLIIFHISVPLSS